MSAAVIDLNDVRPFYQQPDRYDLDLIVQRLRDTAEHWVPRFFPHGRRSGDEWRLANIRGDAPRKMGSCVITLRGPRAGDWIDFDGNQGGKSVPPFAGLFGIWIDHRFRMMADQVRQSGIHSPCFLSEIMTMEFRHKPRLVRYRQEYR